MTHPHEHGLDMADYFASEVSVDPCLPAIPRVCPECGSDHIAGTVHSDRHASVYCFGCQMFFRVRKD
jgi:hypothetical protein